MVVDEELLPAMYISHQAGTDETMEIEELTSGHEEADERIVNDWSWCLMTQMSWHDFCATSIHSDAKVSRNAGLNTAQGRDDG